MKCEKCGHEQQAGKFCGKCGNTLVAQTTASPGPALQNVSQANAVPASAGAPAYQNQASTDPNLHVEKVKETSKQYWGYFLGHLKQPSSILSDFNKNFINSLITFAIFALITALGIYDIVTYFMGPVDEFAGIFAQESIKPSFFKILLNVVLALAVVIALSLGSIYLVSKFFGPPTQFKTLTTIYGTYLIPMTLIVVAAYLLLLIDSRGIGSSLLMIGLFLSLFVMPLFLITTLVNQKPRQLDSFYAFLLYIAMFMIGLSIVLSVLLDSTFSDVLTELNGLFGYSLY